jgi:hypothetical protein
MIIQIPNKGRWQRIKDWCRFRILYRIPFIGKYFGIRGFTKFIFPVIKNMDTSLSINEIMKVQPMNESSGQVFYMDFVYPKKKIRKWYHLWL